MDEYYSWKELYYDLYPHLKLDKTFTDKDIIRFFHNNLDLFEQERVLEYFCDLCQESIDEVPEEEPYMPELPAPPPLLPPPSTPLIPLIPVVPQLPSPPPSLPPEVIPPPIGPEWISPVWPFIIWELLPADILDWILEMVGYPQDLEAAELRIIHLVDELNTIVDELNKKKTEARNFKDLYIYWKEIAQQLESWDKYGPPPWLKAPETVDEWFPDEEEEQTIEEQIGEDTPFEDWWEEFEDPPVTQEEVTDSTWVGGGFTHGEVLRAIEWLLITDDADFIDYQGWYRDVNGNIWYILEEAGEVFEYTGSEVMEVARWYGYPNKNARMH